MLTRTLGRSGIEVSALGLGCWAIGGPFWDQGGWMGYGTVDDDESVRAIHRALDLGINFFDTSDVYGCGHSERILGRALTGVKSPIVIAAKFGYTFDETARRVLGKDASPARIRQACDASLQRLQREYIDVYQLHLHDYDLAGALEVRDVLESLVQEGKIRFYSWCTEDPERVRLFAEGQHCTAAPQLVNLFESNPALLNLCDLLNLAAIARRPLGMGLLTGKYTAASTLANNDMRRRFGWNLKDGKQAYLLEKLALLQEVLSSDGRTLAQGAIGWIWAHSLHTIPIPGFKTVSQVEENAAALSFGPLTSQQMEEIEQIKDH